MPKGTISRFDERGPIATEIRLSASYKALDKPASLESGTAGRKRGPAVANVKIV